MEFILIHDIVNPETGTTYKQENAALTHKFKVGDLVEFKDLGVRLFVARLDRDCDMSLLYALSTGEYEGKWSDCIYGHGEGDLILVR